MSTAPGPTIAELGEHAIIERVRAGAPPAPPWVTIGMGDDAAVIEPARNRAEVVTTDAFVEGVHFDRAYVPPAAIGHKALAVSLSDLAAMGAEPRAALLSLLLPGTMAVADFDAMMGGWHALAARYTVVLIGGNVSRSPGPLVLDVTAIGAVKPRRVLTRSGARPGDGIYVSGSVGAAHAGFLARRDAAIAPAALDPEADGPCADDGHGAAIAPAALEPGAEPGGPSANDDGIGVCEARFTWPDPRIRLGLLLGRSRVASSCVDLSDGLGDGVRQIAAASGVGAEIDGELVPVPGAARRWFEGHGGLDPLDAAISGGEDYELLFTVAPRRRRALAAALRLADGLPCTRIGTITADRSLVVTRRGARAPWPLGFAHFR